MWGYVHSEELYHHGVKGMKWGIRRYQNKDGTLTAAGKKRNARYRSTDIRSAMARRSNEKIDKSFKNWKENTNKRESAIELGKKANVARMAYENDRTNKDLKREYKTANKEYKKALSKNTTYRKGVVRQEVGADQSRKYLSAAKKIKKELDKDPYNKELRKQYADLMSKHDVERAKARKATTVSSKRSRRKAAIKRSMTMTVKATATATAIAAGTYAVNKYMNNHNVTLNGQRVNFSAQNVSNVASTAKKVKDFMGYFY